MAETSGETTGNLGATGAETAREGRSDGDLLSAREKFRQATQDVRRGAERVTDEVRRSAERVTDEVRRGAEVARERYDEAAENLRLGYERVRTQATDVGTQVNTYVRENPGKSVLIAAAAGFLLGLVVRRSRSYDEVD
jgi:ElaB/YqjD/DUF883 family membrane-anchored ribosome-binding protein